MLLIWCIISLTFINAAEKQFLCLKVNNEHSDPVKITYQQYISKPSYVKLKDHTSTAIIAANSSGVIFLLPTSSCNINIAGFKSFYATDVIKEGTVIFRKAHNNQILMSQDGNVVATLAKKLKIDTSSDSEGCVQQ